MPDKHDQDPQNPSTALLPFEGNGRLIRRQWHDGRWFFSVVDVVAVLTDSADPGNYWRVLKSRLQAEGAGEPITNCNRLKMQALDGKLRETDAADVETMLRIIQSIPSPRAEPVKQWLAISRVQGWRCVKPPARSGGSRAR
jgi:DNA-damage-inducible protein D